MTIGRKDRWQEICIQLRWWVLLHCKTSAIRWIPQTKTVPILMLVCSADWLFKHLRNPHLNMQILNQYHPHWSWWTDHSHLSFLLTGERQNSMMKQAHPSLPTPLLPHFYEIEDFLHFCPHLCSWSWCTNTERNCSESHESWLMPPSTWMINQHTFLMILRNSSSPYLQSLLLLASQQFPQCYLVVTQVLILALSWTELLPKTFRKWLPTSGIQETCIPSEQAYFWYRKQRGVIIECLIPKPAGWELVLVLRQVCATTSPDWIIWFNTGRKLDRSLYDPEPASNDTQLLDNSCIQHTLRAWKIDDLAVVTYNIV